MGAIPRLPYVHFNILVVFDCYKVCLFSIMINHTFTKFHNSKQTLLELN